MAKIYCFVGYAETVETEPGIWVEKTVEKPYYGDLIRNSRRLQNSGSVNDNIVVSNQISIISDPYANFSFHGIKYVKFMGSAWKVTSVEVQYPRLILELGEVYNGCANGSSEEA